MNGGRARAAATLVLGAALAGLLPGAGVRLTAAAWADTASDRARITVAADSCTAAGVYTGQASSALLAGSVQGTAIGAPTTLAPVSTGERTDAVSPGRAVVTPAAASDALLSGVTLTPTSTWGQSASTTGTGISAASVGGAAAVGGVDVSAVLTRAPNRTAALPGLSGVGVDIGAVTSSSTLNGCAAAWGDSGTLTRSSTVSSLGLRFSDSAVTTALSTMRTRGTDAATYLTGLTTATATTASLTQAVTDGLRGAVSQPGVNLLGLPAATVTLAAGTAPITATATGAQVSGGSTLDVASGSIVVNVPVPAGPDGDALSPARLAAAAGDSGAALRQRAAALTAAEATVRDGATVTVHAAVDVLSLAGVKVSTVTVDAAAPVSSWRSGVGLDLQARVQLLGSTAVSVDAGITARLATTLLPRVQAALADSFVTPATAATAADVAALTALVDSTTATLGSDLAVLPSVLVVTTDQRGAVAADSWTGSAAAGSGGVTAVRVRVKDPTSTRADLFIGDTAVGPNRGAFR